MKRKFKQLLSTKRTITSHLNLLNIKRQRQMALEIQVLAWDSHKNMARLNLHKLQHPSWTVQYQGNEYLKGPDWQL